MAKMRWTNVNGTMRWIKYDEGKPFIEVDGKWIPYEEEYTQEVNAPMVIGDLAPYQSMATGEWIDGRRAHKAHLKEHKLIEIGNEVNHLIPKERKPDPRLKEAIARQVYEKLRY